MKAKLALAGAIIILAGSLGEAVAGSQTSHKQYSSHEATQSAYRQPPIYNTLERNTARPARSPKSCIYQGGLKTNMWMCR